MKKLSRLSQRGTLLAGLVATFLASTSFHQGVPARAVPPEAVIRHDSIEEALGVHLTPRGQAYFERDLADFLYRVGYNYDTGAFDEWRYEAKEPLSLDRIPVRFAAYRGTLTDVARIVDRWLMNFSLAAPLFEAQLTGLRYGVQFAQLGARFDLEATRQLPRGQGVALKLTAELGAMRFEVDSVRARDRNNSFLGDFGADGVWLATRPDSQPLRVEIPVQIELHPGSRPTIQINQIHTNLEQILLDFGWSRSLILPRVEIEINGRRMQLNQARLETELNSRKAALLQALQAYLQDYIDEHGPEKLNTTLARILPMPLSETNLMTPPGAPSPVPDEDKFRWGFTPATLEEIDGSIHLGLSAWLEDPRDQGRSVPTVRRTRSLPRLDALPPENYDLALSLNQDLINRMLNLSYRRGYFSEVPLSSGKKLYITAAPEFRLDTQNASDIRGKLHAKFSYPVEGIQSLITRSPLDFELDLEVKLVQSAQGIRVELVRGDENTVRIDQSDIKFILFTGKVYRAVREEIRKLNRDLVAAPKVIVDQIPFPSRLGGLPIRIRSLSADSSGHIAVYIEYGFRPLAPANNSRLILENYRGPREGDSNSETPSSPPRRRRR